MNDAAMILMLLLTAAIGLGLVPFLVSRLLRERWNRLGKARWLVFLSMPMVPLAGSLLLEFAGTIVTARLMSRSEEIWISSGGEYDGGGGPSWTRNLRYRVSFQPVGERRAVEMLLRTDTQTFDRLPSSETIPLRYWRWLGLLTYARWAEESPWALVRMYWENDVFRWCFITVLTGFFCYLTYPPRNNRRARKVKSNPSKSAATRVRFWLAVGPLLVWIVMNVYSFFVHGPIPDTSWRQATAKVQGVSLWRDEGYSFIELSFLPSGYESGVVAVDTVDSRSIIGLGKGHEVEIVYPPDNPRQARLAKGTRSYLVLDNLVLLIGAFLVLVVLGVICEWIRRWIRRQQKSAPFAG